MLQPIRQPTRVAIAGLLLAAAVVLGACGSDSTAPGANCEIIYTVSNPPPASGIEVRNATGGGLSVDVEGGQFFGTGSDMGSGDCNVWAYPPGTYQVTLQRCDQAIPGDTSCTTLLGSEVIRSVVVQAGSRTTLQVDGGFFP